METTKIYVVSANNGIYRGAFIQAAFLSKKDADFYCWKKRQTPDSGFSLYCGVSYTVEEVEVVRPEVDAKLYAKFVAEQVKQIDEEITKKKECSEQDEAAIAKLEAEKKSYA